MKCRLVSSALLVGAALTARPQLITYNSFDRSQNETTRTNFYGAVGIAAPQFRVDFESGFTDEQNVEDQPGDWHLVQHNLNFGHGRW